MSEREINAEDFKRLEEQFLLQKEWQLPLNARRADDTKMFVVFRQHKYYKHLNVEMYEAPLRQNGKIKSSFSRIDPLDIIWKNNNIEELKFYTAVSKFQNTFDSDWSESDMEGLKALVKNPLQLDFFYHNAEVSPKITSTSIVPVKLKCLDIDIRLQVLFKNGFYEIIGKLYLADKSYDLDLLNIRYYCFLFYNDTLYLIDNPNFLRVIDFFKPYRNKILIQQSEFEEFQQNILSKLEDKVKISYSYLKRAKPKQLKEKNFHLPDEKLIYLSDLGDYILIIPVMRYGDVEVPVLSKRQIYTTDSHGNPFTVQRKEETELNFISLLVRQHPFFEEQLEGDCFYLHRKRFLENGWFLEVFEDWKSHGITILGFNNLKNNNLNPNKAKISIEVISGLDWFETSLDVRFGNEKVSLKHLHKSLRNKNKFVQLGDGTLGILPDEWLEKFSKYFSAGEMIEESIRIPKANFSAIHDLYDQEMLSKEVKIQLALYREKITNFKNIEEVVVPSTLKGVLRDYQKQGLNWLNFLDEFGFGGCLADDMGLGKTIQVIAFILSQREKKLNNTHLIVVPTTLIFNWQAEIEKFAPSVKVHTIYGAGRVRDISRFDEYEIVLTSYGTLLYDIKFLKAYCFNYVFLDESQTLKNPLSQRYRAVSLLKSYSKIVLTGTPIENNTFDLYGQLSLACPGLLGSKQFFKDHYSSPIDKFKDRRRALELRKKIAPFILRRTKEQVADELPDKTEMVLYCEMGEEQRKVYDSYKKEYQSFLLLKEGEDLSRYTMHVLKGLTILRQICNSPALLKEEVFYGSSSAKIEVLITEIESKSYHHKILVFSQFVTMLDLIGKELKTRAIPFEYLTGQSKNKADKVNQFQQNKEIRVFLISLKAGGTGLNLTEADYVYLVDPWWNPAVENQAIDRCYRIGQKKNVVAVRLICPDTIEEKIMKLQKSKRSLANDLIKTDTDMLKQLSKNDLAELFS